MTKWADYLVSAVKYDADKKITQVMQHKDIDGQISGGELVDRDTVTTNLKKGATYATIFNANSSWQIGDQIRLIRAGSAYSIRTDTNKVEYDNLKFLSEID